MSEQMNADTLVERARKQAGYHIDNQKMVSGKLFDELADEIERLRAEMETGNYLTTNDKLSLGIERQALEIKELQDTITRLRAERPGWRTMESAPKSGRAILFDPKWGACEGNRFVDGKWGLATFNGQIMEAHPTHWQPLPALHPSVAEGRGQL